MSSKEKPYLEVMDERTFPQIRGIRVLHHAICRGLIDRIWQSRTTICALASDKTILLAFDLVPASAKSLSESDLATLERIISGDMSELANAPSDIFCVKLPTKATHIFCTKGPARTLLCLCDSGFVVGFSWSRTKCCWISIGDTMMLPAAGNVEVSAACVVQQSDNRFDLIWADKLTKGLFLTRLCLDGGLQALGASEGRTRAIETQSFQQVCTLDSPACHILSTQHAAWIFTDSRAIVWEPSQNCDGSGAALPIPLHESKVCVHPWTGEALVLSGAGDVYVAGMSSSRFQLLCSLKGIKALPREFAVQGHVLITLSSSVNSIGLFEITSGVNLEEIPVPSNSTTSFFSLALHGCEYDAISLCGSSGLMRLRFPSTQETLRLLPQRTPIGFDSSRLNWYSGICEPATAKYMMETLELKSRYKSSPLVSSSDEETRPACSQTHLRHVASELQSPALPLALILDESSTGMSPHFSYSQTFCCDQIAKFLDCIDHAAPGGLRGNETAVTWAESTTGSDDNTPDSMFLDDPLSAIDDAKASVVAKHQSVEDSSSFSMATQLNLSLISPLRQLYRSFSLDAPIRGPLEDGESALSSFDSLAAISLQQSSFLSDDLDPLIAQFPQQVHEKLERLLGVDRHALDRILSAQLMGCECEFVLPLADPTLIDSLSPVSNIPLADSPDRALLFDTLCSLYSVFYPHLLIPLVDSAQLKSLDRDAEPEPLGFSGESGRSHRHLNSIVSSTTLNRRTSVELPKSSSTSNSLKDMTALLDAAGHLIALPYAPPKLSLWNRALLAIPIEVNENFPDALLQTYFTLHDRIGNHAKVLRELLSLSLGKERFWKASVAYLQSKNGGDPATQPIFAELITIMLRHVLHGPFASHKDKLRRILDLSSKKTFPLDFASLLSLSLTQADLSESTSKPLLYSDVKDYFAQAVSNLPRL